MPFRCVRRSKEWMILVVFIICNLCDNGANAFQIHNSNSPLSSSPIRSISAKSVTALNLVGDLGNTILDSWNSYNQALENAPLITKSITAGVILGAADLAGQALENSGKETQIDDDDDYKNDSSVDLARALRFATFGLILQAPWNHFYYLLLDGALPPTEDPFTTTTGIKVVIDQFIQAPIFTILIFYFLGILEGKSLEAVKLQLDKDYKDTMFANWKLWVPATAVNIAFCPPALRVLFLNCVFFFWSIFLSLKLNSDENGEEVI